MFRFQRSVFLYGGLIGVIGVTAWAYSTATVQKVDPATLHPQRSVLYGVWDGGEMHAAAIKDTAQYKSLVESGLFDYARKMLNQVLTSESVMSELGPGPSAEELKQGSEAFGHFKTLYESGFSISISDGPLGEPPAPLGTVVLHDAAGSGELMLPLLQLAGMGAQPQARTVAGRDVLSLPIPGSPGFELAWFSEAQHLVVAVGPAAAEQAIGIADGRAPNVTASARYQKYRDPDTDFEVAAAGWFDFGALRNRFGEMPLPVPDVAQPPTINDFATALGIDSLGVIGGQMGYRGTATIARTFVEAPSPRRGLLALLDQPLFTLEDLPALPQNASVFAAFSLDAATAWDTVLKSTRDTLALLPPEIGQEFEDSLRMLPLFLGLDLRNDLLAPLGDVHCFYGDPAGGPFGIGFGVAFSVTDADKLRSTVDALVAQGERLVGQVGLPVSVTAQRAHVDGRQLITVPAGVFTPTVAVDDEWMVMSLYPQSVKTFFMRQDGALPKWTPTHEHREALAELPQKFSAISIDDPRSSISSLYGFVPMVNSTMHTMMPHADGRGVVKAADLPPLEVVVGPLFPNVSVSVPGESGLEYHTRQSLAMLPMPSVQSGAAVPILVALLLPAVQQARMAARRTVSKNNMKQLGLAMFNYHDVYNHLPVGTQPDTDLKPEQRLSFFYSILPYMEQAPLYKQMRASDKTRWDGNQLRRLTAVSVETFHNPNLPTVLPHATHYVGMAGVGEDAPELPVRHARAGIFGYDRKTRFRDVLDGTSNTIMLTETNEVDIPWAAGGQTLKSLTQEPYINGPDGIGSPTPGGCNVLMADGSVRFISEHTDPEMMRRLAAMADGKVVDF
jgi:prepilin-type processing-associated H-X9-DG protein